MAILSNVSKYVKVGGFLYYSTCSILPEENIGTINKFLDANKNYKIVDIDSKLPHLNINGTNQFLPNISSGAGFFLAKLQRLS
jgi:16S rRNA (cytosine967-C5)-methyltransferase